MQMIRNLTKVRFTSTNIDANISRQEDAHQIPSKFHCHKLNTSTNRELVLRDEEARWRCFTRVNTICAMGVVIPRTKGSVSLMFMLYTQMIAINNSKQRIFQFWTAGKVPLKISAAGVSHPTEQAQLTESMEHQNEEEIFQACGTPHRNPHQQLGPSLHPHLPGLSVQENFGIIFFKQSTASFQIHVHHSWLSGSMLHILRN